MSKSKKSLQEQNAEDIRRATAGLRKARTAMLRMQEARSDHFGPPLITTPITDAFTAEDWEQWLGAQRLLTHLLAWAGR